MDIAEVLKRKKPRTVTVDMVLDDVPVQRRDTLAAEIRRVQKQESWADNVDMASPLPKLLDDLDVAEAEVADAVVEFKFQAMPSRRWQELYKQHVPEDAKEVSNEFCHAIIAESSVDPELTVTDVADMYDLFASAEMDHLYLAVFKVNREQRDIPFTVPGTRLTSDTGQNSTTASQEDSDTQSS